MITIKIILLIFFYVVGFYPCIGLFMAGIMSNDSPIPSTKLQVLCIVFCLAPFVYYIGIPIILFVI